MYKIHTRDLQSFQQHDCQLRDCLIIAKIHRLLRAQLYKLPNEGPLLETSKFYLYFSGRCINPKLFSNFKKHE
jgi:hypothetical protein